MNRTSAVPGRGGSSPPLPPFGRLRLVALIIPSLLLAALIGLDYFALERLLPSEEGHAVMLVVGLAGVVAFSLVIFARLTDLHARLAQQSAKLVASEERHRISAELQDGVIQSLYGVSLVIEDATERVETEPAAVKLALTRAVDRLETTIVRVRATLQS